MRANFRRIRDEGFGNTCFKLIEIPCNFLRDYSTPIGDEEAWNRTRASVVPVFVVMSFLYMNGMMQPTDDGSSYWSQPQVLVGFICMAPGLLIGLAVRFRTKVSSPPPGLLTIYSCLCFIMAVVWIQFTSNEIMDLLQLFGFVSHLPESLLALTIIAWGNCLGDMTADVAMAKRGFGEMAITGTIAGPIFNILAGLGLGQTATILKSSNPMKEKINFGFNDRVINGIIDGKTCSRADPCFKYNPVSVLPLTLLLGQSFVLTLILASAIRNKF